MVPGGSGGSGGSGDSEIVGFDWSYQSRIRKWYFVSWLPSCGPVQLPVFVPVANWTSKHYLYNTYQQLLYWQLALGKVLSSNESNPLLRNVFREVCYQGCLHHSKRLKDVTVLAQSRCRFCLW